MIRSRGAGRKELATNDETSQALKAEIDAWINDPANADFFKAEEDLGTDRGSRLLAPSDPLVITAAQYLASVPTNFTPIDTAKYMIRTIPPGELMEWPPDRPGVRLPANPLIVAFFSATRTNPAQGDETAWCAAFVCWVLRHCGKPYPNSAGSKSFRNFAGLPETADPQPGDLVVFQNLRHPDNGHVTFFDGFVDGAKSEVWCVGGNQGNRLSRVKFQVQGPLLRVVSYRTGPDIRPARV
jgi:uncharacterized protein (TIGR02594 family)